MVKGSAEYLKISTMGPIRRCIKTGVLQTRTAKWAFCNVSRITFLDSPYS